ncbi:DUF4362 domain-containing protein [Sporosarcina sp. YIM B06819]|uniref:DUF4362 domain-containing protein n=1 Tax=Sporosarcina sp. YIM B06819 TaxID=3081769 RepID=UPI00298D5BA7|nr:DUF4362 domain-containing protein [Sporosarcina sp. YIM B06819]
MQKMGYVLWILGILLLSACSYDSEKAVKNGDVINHNGPVYNFPRFELFLDRIEANKPATVRIANYTLEGDPTLYNLTFDGSSIDLEIDRSNNNNRGDEPAKVNRTCQDLVMEEGQQVVTYMLKGCDQGSFTDGFVVLTVLKDQEEHDEH